ncbi:C4-dicarboxylate ABC transporter permease, partial [Ruminococcaceae bacterium OttesenSCG-928-D13]|nr:C4-dicarboxylate ABC transporter permease [Ruminococcaceae bacterium OttesenSCG-928-D13]
MSGNAIEKKKKGFKVPHTYVILFLIVILMAVLSWIIPAGQYDRVLNEATGRNVVDPESYHTVEQSPVGPFDLFKSITLGMQESADIIFFILIVGGAFEIINATGAIESGISRLALSMRNKDMILIPIVMLVFFVFGGTIGMSEECIAFVPIGIALARALGYDAIVGTAMVTIGAACGFTSGFMNPFTVGVAQGIAELPPFSGIGLRLVLGGVVLVVSCIYLIRYCGKLKKDKNNSLILEVEKAAEDTAIDLDNLPKFTVNHALVLVAFFGGIVALVIGVFQLGWYIDEIATVFLIVGILSGLIGKIGPSRICSIFL